MNSTKHLNQLPLETELPPLRIAYKNAEVVETKTVKVIKKSKTVKVYQKAAKEPLPLFNDYKFKAKDFDPL
jgi:nicotinic acid phosphoribosyltransferase